MTKVDIISGFLGAGKTTLIKKLLKEALNGQQTVLIENEFGEIGIDGGFLKEAGIEIREMNSGCICCSLVGDFTTSLKEVLTTYHPDRIIIEPSGVGKLSDVIVAVQKAMEGEDVQMNSSVAVVDVLKCKMYMKNFGEFFNNQIENAGTIVLSRTGKCSDKKMKEALELIRGLNEKATVITTDWDELDGNQILKTMEETEDMGADMLAELIAEHEEHEHHHHHDHHHDHEHHHHHDGEECSCGHDHDHDHEHHHHDGEECGCGHHHDHDHEHHHHHHGEECGCGHHHDADEIFDTWGFESPRTFTREELDQIMKNLTEEDDCGVILRSKGMVPSEGNTWLYFDMVPEEYEIREGNADVTGKVVVIGAQLNKTKLKELFGA